MGGGLPGKRQGGEVVGPAECLSGCIHTRERLTFSPICMVARLCLVTRGLHDESRRENNLGRHFGEEGHDVSLSAWALSIWWAEVGPQWESV